jgi:hypothetical protein
MKKLALINTFCNSNERLVILSNNLLKLKNMGIDSLVYSPIPLPKSISLLADYVIISKENPIITYPEKGMGAWRHHPPSQIKTTIIYPDYGWASFYQYKKLIEFGITLNYDHYFPLIYDLNIDAKVIEMLNNCPKKMFFPSPKAKTSKVGATFMSLSKENIQKLIPLFTKKEYLNYSKNSIAEKFIEYLCSFINGDISPYIVQDDVHELKNHQFTLSPKLESNLDFDFFVHTVDKIGFYFYNISNSSKEIQIIIEDETFKYNLNSKEIFWPPVNFTPNPKILFKYNSITTDISEYFSKNHLKKYKLLDPNI